MKRAEPLRGRVALGARAASRAFVLGWFSSLRGRSREGSLLVRAAPCGGSARERITTLKLARNLTFGTLEEQKPRAGTTQDCRATRGRNGLCRRDFRAKGADSRWGLWCPVYCNYSSEIDRKTLF